MFEGMRRGKHLQGNFLLPAVLMMIFHYRGGPYGREEIDFGLHL